MFGRIQHVSMLNGNINKYSSGSAGGVMLQLQSGPLKKTKYVVSSGLKRHVSQFLSIPLIFHWVPNQGDMSNYWR